MTRAAQQEVTVDNMQQEVAASYRTRRTDSSFYMLGVKRLYGEIGSIVAVTAEIVGVSRFHITLSATRLQSSLSL